MERNDSYLAKSKYVVPNVITGLSMMMGLVSMYYSFHGNYVIAGWLIFYSVILDKLDGSTARALKASSDFGVQFDSFSDFVAFGIAPAFLAFTICTKEPSVSAAFTAQETPFFLYFSLVFFVLTSAMRLARFNVTTMPGGRFMYGMATTVAGGLIAGYVLTGVKHIEYSFFIVMLQALPYLLLITGALQISNLPILKVGMKRSQWGKMLDLSGFVILFLCVVFRMMPEVLLLSGTSYLVIGFWHGYKERSDVPSLFSIIHPDSGHDELEREEEATQTSESKPSQEREDDSENRGIYPMNSKERKK